MTFSYRGYHIKRTDTEADLFYMADIFSGQTNLLWACRTEAKSRVTEEMFTQGCRALVDKFFVSTQAPAVNYRWEDGPRKPQHPRPAAA